MKIGFITTIQTNIGDDFIRTGIENILDSIKGSKRIRYTYVNKHHPETATSAYSPVHFLNKLPQIKGKNFLLRFYHKYLHIYFNVYAGQDLIIQSGAPVLWPNCQDNEWAQPIWYDIVGKLKDKVPTINLAAGSCYPWERKENFTNEREAEYAKDIGGFCKLTTTRDTLAHRLFTSVGVTNTLMPCTAFYVSPKFENPNKGKYILINYMKGGGHFDWDQKIDSAKWETTMKAVVAQLSQHDEVHFICHNEQEVKLANEVFPGMPVHFPKTVAEYLTCIEHAKLGINNRMHASVAMASVGVPSISICTDTRLLMLETIGMPNLYVKDVTEETLLQTARELLEKGEQIRTDLFRFKKETFTNYQSILKPFVG